MLSLQQHLSRWLCLHVFLLFSLFLYFCVAVCHQIFSEHVHYHSLMYSYCLCVNIKVRPGREW